MAFILGVETVALNTVAFASVASKLAPPQPTRPYG